MVLLLLTLAAGTAVGYARHGRLKRLAVDPPTRNRLVLTALGIYALGVLGGWAWQPLLPTLTATCWLVLAFYAWVNRGRRGAQLVALGLAANGLVILLNGGMPVSASAEARAGVEPSAGVTEVTDHATVAGTGTTLGWLGKSIPVAFPPSPEVVSPGDIALAAGGAAVLASGMSARRSTRAEQDGGRQRAPERPARRTPAKQTPVKRTPAKQTLAREPGPEIRAGVTTPERPTPPAGAATNADTADARATVDIEAATPRASA